ncbi:U3 small nucleolar ribonucleoprotein IMP4-like [Petromyzon marinus]|uniref:U3 small nucleolar ribonucleoprotein IMP4-like n=1 Tax=Petromyzon marinus TaxID=7757 RepID=UPI003F72D1EA
MVTTSRDPSSLLKQFIKEMKLILPNAQPINHGGHKLQALVWACCANAVNDFIVLHEHRRMPGTTSTSATARTSS